MSYIVVAIVSFITGVVASALFYRRNKDAGDKIIKTVEDKINNIGV